ncbi:cellulase family glycosylhydrolase [Catenovulum adriaticum]|uniref:Cellulase family glycosylhydrolase n=1 Tax=Catenovulum adriaticum TaxID=2984846 RepID=A0ABY7AT86_9ALTE|nr:carbohydrate-binding protein [Catenovulum sp. TS8]WAJ72482.1 cellulase family glycosylhydrolase [Catenovulum sp. TS8]
MIDKHKKQFIFKPLGKFVALACFAIATTGCDLNSTDANKNNGVTVYPTEPDHSFTAPRAGQEQFSRLRQEGKYWVNEQNEVVSLRGINLGNWLTLETWMMNSGDNPVGDGIEDQCSFEAKLTERFGFDEKERLMDLYRDNYITERDWNIIAEAGFNLLRLPFPYDLIENDAQPKTLRNDAWVYLDKTITEAKARNMYVILDLHGAAGRQGWEHHSGCTGLNEFWGGDQTNPDLALAAENQERTKWLWQQIAQRYKNEPTVAGYGLINEPWGTDAENLADVSTELYQAIREVDQNTIVILPGHNSGIQAYGLPAEQGLENVALEMHFYPGIFDDLGISYKTQRNWLTCGLLGSSGMCEWDEKIDNIQTPFLVGEMQPWTGLGEQGGAITRATFDKYNELGWAGTVWSYKVMSRDGGQGNGTWGLVTNKGDRLLAKADTWACAGWDNNFDEACGQPAKIVTPTDDDQSFYLVVKSGSFGGGQDIQLDDIQLIEQSTGNNILANSSFDADSAWLEWSATNNTAEEDNLTVEVNYPQDENNSVLRISALEGSGFVNGGAYQKVELTGGESYLLSGHFADKGSKDTWAEVYLLPAEPINGQDVNGSAMPSIDLNNSSLEEIENYFKLQSTIEYDKHQTVIDALTAEQPPVIFDLPYRPVNLSLVEDEETNTIDLSWKAVDGAKYNVYRSNVSGRDYQLIAQGIESNYYTDTDKPEGVTGYYTVTALNETDESYYSKEVASAFSAFEIPGLIQAENYIAQTGFELENTSDEGGGQNTGHAQTGDTLEYLVNITEAGEYNVEFRFATEAGSRGFTMSLGENQIATVSVPVTGGWQTWQTVSHTITIETTGEQTLKLEAIDDEWNFNWMRFNKN